MSTRCCTTETASLPAVQGPEEVGNQCDDPKALSEKTNKSEETSIFLEAQDQFLKSLPENERLQYSTCSSAEEVLLAVQQYEVIAKQKQKGIQLFRRIKIFSDSLQPYFNVIDVVIQAHPNWAAIGWGALRLILQLASNFAEFFEKLTLALERLSVVFPQFVGIEILTRDGASPALKSSLRLVYVDLFEVFRILAGVFTKSNGKPKKSLLVVGSLLWKPFDIRFHEILNRLQGHKDILNDEITLWQMNTTNDSRKAEVEERQRAAIARDQAQRAQVLTEQMISDVEHEHKQQAFGRLLHWLSPPEFMQELEDAQDLREDGTAYWLLDEPLFVNWRNSAWHPTNLGADSGKSTSCNVLWVKGNPGSGKTVLAGSMIQELRTYPFPSPSPVCYFFFCQDATHKSSNVAAYRSILAQILQHKRLDEGIIDAFTFAMLHETGGQMVASKFEMVGLLKVCLSNLENTFLVLDAIDECNNAQGLMQDLLKAMAGSQTRILLFSRPNVACLHRCVPMNKRISIRGSSVDQDIELYLLKRIEALLEEGLLPQCGENAPLVAQLLQGADGMFLWASLMIKYLESPALTPAQRLAAIQAITIPEGLDQMYERILGLIATATSAEQDLAKRVFTWLTYAVSTLRVDQLHGALTAVCTKPDGSHKFVDFEHSVIISCAGLVEFSASKHCRFIHLSLKEYFLRRPRSFLDHQTLQPAHWQSLLPKSIEGHLEILSECLAYLSFQTPAQPLSGKLGQSAAVDDLDQAFPLLRYSSVHWMFHLKGTVPEHCSFTGAGDDHNVSTARLNSLCRSLLTFISQKKTVMAWVEAFYCFAEGRTPFTAGLRSWCDWVSSNSSVSRSDNIRYLANSICELSHDIDILHSLWGSVLSCSPCDIWLDTTAFTPSKFFAQTAATTVSSLAPQNEGQEILSSYPLTTISGISEDSSEVGVLSIWPSRTYEEWVRSCLPSDHRSDLRNVCCGWMARYEIWNIERTPLLTEGGYIPLDENEIRIQICQSLSRNILKPTGSTGEIGWRLQFPLAISRNLVILTILRTVVFFKRRQDGSDKRCNYTKVVIPMEFDERIRLQWSDEACTVGKCPVRLTSGSYELAYHQLYQYLFKFSPDSRFLFFADLSNQGFSGKPGRVAVYDFPSLHHRPRVRLLDSLNKSMGILGPQEISFHPTLPLIAWISMDGSANLWDFSIPDRRSEEVDNLLKTPGAVYFSHCGTRLGILYSDYSLPTMIPVESLAVFRMVKLRALSSQRQVGQDQLSVISKTISPQAEILFAAWLNDLNDRNSDTYASKISPWHSRISRDIQYWAVLEDCIRTQPITKLPKWSDIEQANPVIIEPETIGEKVKIVLNKSGKQWCSISDSRDARLPTIVIKDRRALLQPAFQPLPSSTPIPIQGSVTTLDEITPVVSTSEPVSDHDISDPPIKAFNRSVMMWIVAIVIMCYHQMAFASLLPIYLLDDPQKPICIDLRSD